MIKKLFIFILCGILAAVIGTGSYFYINLKAYDTEGISENTEFLVEKGESLFSVLDRLESEGLIRNATVVKIYVRFFSPVIVKNGIYLLNAGMGPREILDLLEQGKQELVKVTIPEGLTSRQIAGILHEKGIIESEESFLALLESRELMDSLDIVANDLQGYLFPDTYYFQKDFPADKVVSYMVQTFFETLEGIYPYYQDFSPAKMQEKLILASIVEKEYRIGEEAGRIASVFYNRLNIGMPLQSCATVIYVLTEELGKDHPSRIFERDLKVESPYNTYINPALPPGPICNPGRVALDAAFNPEQTDFLFFVVKDSSKGTHTFTNNYTDHNVARQDYLDGFRSK